MSTHGARFSVLGTEWAETERWATRRTGFLGLGRVEVPVAPLRFLDWTIDGRPLRDFLGFPDGTPCRDITLLTEGSQGEPFAIESLRVLLGDHRAGVDPWVRFSDGRAGILFCEGCAGLDCGAVTAEIVVAESHVEWRDVAYQGVPELLATDAVAPFTLRFRRAEYEATLTDVLQRWSEARM